MGKIRLIKKWEVAEKVDTKTAKNATPKNADIATMRTNWIAETQAELERQRKADWKKFFNMEYTKA